jgi:hypothetical protein
LFNSGTYFAVVCAVRVLEKLIEFLVHGGALRELPDYMSTHFTWHPFLAIQLWILVLFLMYTLSASSIPCLRTESRPEYCSPGVRPS